MSWLREFEEKEISRQSYSIEESVNSKEKNPKDFCLDLVQEFGLIKGREMRKRKQRKGRLVKVKRRYTTTYVHGSRGNGKVT